MKFKVLMCIVCEATFVLEIIIIRILSGREKAFQILFTSNTVASIP